MESVLQMVTDSYKIKIYKTRFGDGSEKFNGTVEFKELRWWFPITITYKIVNDDFYTSYKLGRGLCDIVYFETYDECYKVINNLINERQKKIIVSVEEVTQNSL